MASLTQHLNTPGDHGRLAFRRDCPRCRADRLYGPLAERPAVVPRSVRAGLAAAALAATSSPAAALAQDAGPTGGVGPPVAPGDVGSGSGGGGNGSDDGNGSSGGGGDSEGVGAGAPSSREGGEDEETSESVPVTTPVGSASPPESSSEPAGGSGSEESASEPTAPSRGSGESSGGDRSSGSGSAEGSGDEGSGSDQRSGDDEASSDTERSGSGDEDKQAGNSVDNAPVAGKDTDPQDEDKKRDAGKTALRDDDEDGGVGAQARSGYTVEAGDSLWAIAERVYATESDAETAEAVHRLWELNSKRIATGDPDLIHPDQELRLR